MQEDIKAPDDFFNDNNRVKAQWIKFTKPGDWVKGTLTSKRETDASGPYAKPGEKVWIYEIKAHGGSFHELDEDKQLKPEPIIVNAGDFWQIGGKKGIDAQLRNAKLGQIVGLRFNKSIPNKIKGYNPAKQIEAYVGAMDPDYMGESSADSFGTPPPPPAADANVKF